MVDTMAKKSTAGSTGTILHPNLMYSADDTGTHQTDTVSVVEVADNAGIAGGAESDSLSWI